MDKFSIIRTILLVVALVNQFLTVMGKSPLPFNDSEMELFFSTLITAATALWSWWKNNYISKTGLKQKEVLQNHDLYKK